jgi:hypothetical protein
MSFIASTMCGTMKYSQDGIEKPKIFLGSFAESSQDWSAERALKLLD